MHARERNRKKSDPVSTTALHRNKAKQKENARRRETHHIPEAEPALDLRLGVLDALEGLLANVERHLLRFLYAFRIRIPYALAAVDVRECVEVDLGEDAKAGVNLRLERKR